MEKQPVRVVLASGHPATLDLLREAAEQEEGTVVVGEAGNAARAVTLSRNLRPDVTVIDSHLPHFVGLDDVPLSRIGGMDAAQTIVGRVPDTRVVLLNNLESEDLVGYDRSGARVVFAVARKDTTVPFTLRELHQQPWSDNSLVFASLNTTRSRAPQRTSSNLIVGGIFFGGAAALTGWALIVTLWLVPAGLYVAAAGFAVLLLSLTAKLLLSVKTRLIRMPGRSAKDSHKLTAAGSHGNRGRPE